MPEVFAYYDRDVDIVWLPIQTPAAAGTASSAQQSWGLLDLDPDGTPVGLEIWDASTRLPAPILSALPDPPHDPDAST